MFQTTPINQRNHSIEGLVRLLFGMMTVLLIVPVAIILAVLVVKGGPLLSVDFPVAVFPEAPPQAMAARLKHGRRGTRRAAYSSFASSALASLRSGVSKPSVNQP